MVQEPLSKSENPQPDPLLEAEIEHLLSNVVDPRTHSGRILRYLADAYLTGRTESLKEYAVAVDALGRPPAFDPKVDSIVRVEIHKLRKLLREYYESAGSQRPIAVAVAPGSYRLTVTAQEPSSGPAVAAESEPPPESQAVAPEPPVSHAAARGPRRFGAVLVALLILVAGALVWQATRSAEDDLVREGAASAAVVGAASPAASSPAAAAGAGLPLRISAGATQDYTDQNGRTWLADTFFEGGRVSRATSSTILFSRAREIYLTRREGDFHYRVPVAPGYYEVRMHFAETQYGDWKQGGGGEASRMFRVSINGAPVLDPFDVVAEAGSADFAHIRVIGGVKPADDGKIHLRFESLVNEKAFLSGLEILPGLPDRALPLRLVAGPAAVTDSSGNRWEPEDHFLGGRIRDRHNAVAGGPDPLLFRNERFGNFRYRLPAIPGHSYRLTVYAAEQFFEVEARPPRGQRRRFDILADGKILHGGIDLINEAGGPLRAVRHTFPHLRGSPQGYLEVHFRPVSNYALLNALELVDEGPVQ